MLFLHKLLSLVQLFVEKNKGTKVFDNLYQRRKKESRHSFGKESTIWQWLKAEGTKNVSAARKTSTRLSQNVASNPIFKSRNSQKTNCSWSSALCFEKTKIGVRKSNKYLSEEPDKTNIGPVKMMEAKCEVIVIILIGKY